MTQKNKKNKIELATLRKRLQTHLDYELTAYHWDVLLYGWAERERRRHRRINTSAIRARGWVSKKDAVSISDYVGYNLL